MEFFLEFTKITVQSFVLGFASPVFIISIFLIYTQLKEVKMTNQLTVIDTGKHLFDSVMYGIFFAFIGSILSSILGIYIVFDYNMIHIISIIAIIATVLYLFNINLSYLFPLLILINLVWSDLIDIRGIMALIGMLFIIQALLMISFGTKNLIPTFVLRENRYIGAFYNIHYWPVPIVFLILSVLLNDNLPAQSVSFNEPLWWPLLNTPDISNNETFFYTLASIPIIISSKELYVHDKPEKLIKFNSAFYFVFGLILVLTVALLSNYIFIYAIAFIYPLIYELYICIKWNNSMQKEPYYKAGKEGVKALYVMQDGKGKEIGIKSGDVIVSINGLDVKSALDLRNILNERPQFLDIKIKRDNKIQVLKGSFYPGGIKDLKIIYIESRIDKINNIIDNKKIYKSLYLLIKQKNM